MPYPMGTISSSEEANRQPARQGVADTAERRWQATVDNLNQLSSSRNRSRYSVYSKGFFEEEAIKRFLGFPDDMHGT